MNYVIALIVSWCVLSVLLGALLGFCIKDRGRNRKS